MGFQKKIIIQLSALYYNQTIFHPYQEKKNIFFANYWNRSVQKHYFTGHFRFRKTERQNKIVITEK